MPEYKCTCPDDWQGMDHTRGCKARAQLAQPQPEYVISGFSIGGGAYSTPQDALEAALQFDLHGAGQILLRRSAGGGAWTWHIEG